LTFAVTVLYKSARYQFFPEILGHGRIINLKQKLYIHGKKNFGKSFREFLVKGGLVNNAIRIFYKIKGKCG